MQRSLIAIMLALACAASSAQEAYPSRPITLIVPFPPGGVADITGRPTANALEKILKQPVVISNRPGAGGAVGNSLVANAKPDGYTLLMALSSISVIPEADKLFDRKPAVHARSVDSDCPHFSRPDHSCRSSIPARKIAERSYRAGACKSRAAHVTRLPGSTARCICRWRCSCMPQSLKCARCIRPAAVRRLPRCWEAMSR